MRKFLRQHADDLCLAVGCAAILTGLALWNLVVTWVVGGLMLIGWGVLIGKVMAK